MNWQPCWQDFTVCSFAKNNSLTYTGPLVGLEGVPEVTPAYRAVLSVLAGVLTAAVAMVTCYCGHVKQERITSWRDLHAYVLPAYVGHIQMQSLWFLASSNPGRHSQATPPLGVSLQMWAQPCSLFIQLRPSEIGRGWKAHKGTHGKRLAQHPWRQWLFSHLTRSTDIKPRVTSSTYTKPGRSVYSLNKKLAVPVASPSR